MGLDMMITKSQAARLVGVSRQLVHRWVQLGHLTVENGRVRARDALEVEAKTRQVSGRRVGQIAA